MRLRALHSKLDAHQRNIGGKCDSLTCSASTGFPLRSKVAILVSRNLPRLCLTCSASPPPHFYVSACDGPPAVCVTGIAGVLNLVGVVITFGFVKYDEPSLLSNCFFQGWVTWTGAGLFYCAAVVRVSSDVKRTVALRVATTPHVFFCPIALLRHRASNRRVYSVGTVLYEQELIVMHVGHTDVSSAGQIV